MSEAIFAQIVRDVRDSLNDEDMVSHWLGEPAPLDMQIVYRPPAKANVPVASGLPEAAPSKTFRHIPPNFACGFCPERMYPVKRFMITGKLPVLVLFFNGSVTPTKIRPERSDICILASKEEDALFEQTLRDSGFSGMSDFYFQQFPACHFNPQRSTMSDWQRRANHCTEHVRATIQTHGIKHILVSSPSSQFLLGKEETQRLTTSGEMFSLPIGSESIPANAFKRVDPRTGPGVLSNILADIRAKY
ncbi:MAG: hypothetical protein JNM27_18290 [Leptospirales bacterium]|nr:hypothetical protein [Leptospirales bacterium]